MTTSTPAATGDDGISRREALRKGATISVALAAATPVVQGLGSIAAYAQTSPPPKEPPPNEPPPRVETTPSHFQLLVRFEGDGTLRGIKWDGSWSALFQQGNRCWDPNAVGFEAATATQVQLMNTSGSVTTTERGYEATMPAGVTVVHTATFDGGGCYYPGEAGGPFVDGSTYVFPKPSSGQGNS